MSLPTNLILLFLPTIQSNIKPNFRSFRHYLTEPSEELFLISPLTKNYILEIISSLNNNKATGINSVLIKILKVAKEQITEDLCFIYNLSFTTDIFPAVYKLLKSHKFTKMFPNLSVLTIDPPFCYQIWINCIKCIKG